MTQQKKNSKKLLRQAEQNKVLKGIHGHGLPCWEASCSLPNPSELQGHWLLVEKHWHLQLEVACRRWP